MESIKVKDIMVPLNEYATIPEGATIHEAVLALEQAREKFDSRGYRHRAVIVIDATGKAVGKLSQLDLLRSLEPKYAEMGDLKKVSGYGLSAGFLRSMLDRYELWQAPVDDICRKASEKRVSAMIASPLEGEFIDEEASLNQAVHQLIMGHHQSLLVTANDQITGILRLTDVFQEISNRIKACGVPQA
jgi:predicted transcriptional regulator